MEPPLSSLVLLVFGFSISICALLVESQFKDGVKVLSSLQFLELTPSPPPPPPSPSPPPESPSPPPPQSPPPPPPESPPPPPPKSPPPPPSKSPPPPSPPRPPNQLNSKNESNRPPPPDHKWMKRNNSRHRRPPPPPPRREHKINAGKKIGLLFAGIAGILQIGVVGFLVFKKRQLLKDQW